MPRSEALAYVLPHFDALTHMVIRVSSAFIFQTFDEPVCNSVFVKRLSFKSLLNLRKAYIFQEFAEGLLSICGGSTYRLSVIIQFGSRSVKIFDLCRLSVNLS